MGRHTPSFIQNICKLKERRLTEAARDPGRTPPAGCDADGDRER